MVIKFYKNTLEKNKVDKSNMVSSTAPVELEGTLKEATSLVAPSFLVHKNFKELINYNYVYIEDFKRYYYITDITSVTNELSRIELHVDVLMSFKDEIMENEAFIERNETLGSEEIYDSLRDTYAIPTMRKYSVTSAEIKEGDVNSLGFPDTSFPPEDNSLYFIFTIFAVNEISSRDRISPPSPSDTILPISDTWANGTKINCNSYVTREKGLINLLNYFNYDSKGKTNRESLINIICVPYLPDHGNQVSYLSFGTDNVKISDNTYLQAGKYYTYKSKWLTLADFHLPNITTTTTYLQGKASYKLWIPCKGYIDLDYASCTHDRIQVLMYNEPHLNQSLIIAVNTSTKAIVYSSVVALGLDIPVTTTNITSINENWLQTFLGLGISGITTAVSAMSGNPFGVAQGVGMIGGGVSKIVSTAIQSKPETHGNVSSNNLNYVLPNTAYLLVYYDEIIESKVPFAKYYGLPLDKDERLHDLVGTGFTKVGDIHLVCKSATEMEFNEILSLLHTGVIL